MMTLTSPSPSQVLKHAGAYIAPDERVDDKRRGRQPENKTSVGESSDIRYDNLH